MHFALYKRSGTVLLCRSLLLFFVSGVDSGFAQGGFKNRYYLPNSLTSVCTNVIETPAGSLIGLGVTVDTIFGRQVKRLTLIGTDAQGNFQWKKSYGDSTLQYYSNIEQGFVDSTGYYQAVVADDPGLRTIGALIKFNFQGDTVWQRIFRDPNPLDDIIPMSVTKSVDGGFLMTGFFQNWGASGYNKLLIIKTDCDGRELWRKKLDGTASNWQKVIWGYGILQDSASKKILISGFQYLGPNANAYTIYGSIFCFDSIGNSLWQKAFMNQGSGPLNRILKGSDNKFIAVGDVCSSYDSWGSCKWWKSAAVKFDISGNEIWNKSYDSEGKTSFRFLSEREDKNVVLVGMSDSSIIHHRNGSTAVRVMLINTNGTMLNSRIIGSSQETVYGTDEIPKSFFPCKDKGFVLATYFTTANNPRPYSIVKIDSTFCDTTEQYCRDILTEIKTESRITQGFELYPNPARGEVFVDLTNPSETIYRVKMFEVSGRLIKEVVLASGEKNSVSLTDVNAGIYFVSLYSEQRCIATKKIVVEE